MSFFGNKYKNGIKLVDLVNSLLSINPNLPLNQNSTLQDILTVLESGNIGGGSNARMLTQYEYDNLSNSEKELNLFYLIKG